MAAVDLAVDHRLQIWDAVIPIVSAEVECDLFPTKDLQDGFRVRGMTIVNPFAASLHPGLAVLLA